MQPAFRAPSQDIRGLVVELGISQTDAVDWPYKNVLLSCSIKLEKITLSYLDAGTILWGPQSLATDYDSSRMKLFLAEVDLSARMPIDYESSPSPQRARAAGAILQPVATPRRT